eukprot:gene10166-biopygen12783
MNEFKERLTKSPADKDLFGPIKREPLKTFKDSSVKTRLKIKGKEKVLTFQRDILGTLVAYSNKHEAGVDLETTLSFPLAPVSMPLSTADGAIRKTVKSKLYEAAMSDLSIVSPDELPPTEILNTHYLDLAAAIQSLVGPTSTLRQMATNILASIPARYTQIVIVCDTYKDNSIKGGERVKRGDSGRYVLTSPDMKPDSNDLQQTTKVTEDSVEVLEHWASNLEEADTKLGALIMVGMKKDQFVGVKYVTRKIYLSELLPNQAEVNEKLETEDVECNDSEDDFEDL